MDLRLEPGPESAELRATGIEPLEDPLGLRQLTLDRRPPGEPLIEPGDRRPLGLDPAFRVAGPLSCERLGPGVAVEP